MSDWRRDSSNRLADLRNGQRRSNGAADLAPIPVAPRGVMGDRLTMAPRGGSLGRASERTVPLWERMQGGSVREGGMFERAASSGAVPRSEWGNGFQHQGNPPMAATRRPDGSLRTAIDSTISAIETLVLAQDDDVATLRARVRAPVPENPAVAEAQRERRAMQDKQVYLDKLIGQFAAQKSSRAPAASQTDRPPSQSAAVQAGPSQLRVPQLAFLSLADASPPSPSPSPSRARRKRRPNAAGSVRSATEASGSEGRAHSSGSDEISAARSEPHIPSPPTTTSCGTQCGELFSAPLLLTESRATVRLGNPRTTATAACQTVDALWAVEAAAQPAPKNVYSDDYPYADGFHEEDVRRARRVAELLRDNERLSHRIAALTEECKISHHKLKLADDELSSLRDLIAQERPAFSPPDVAWRRLLSPSAPDANNECLVSTPLSVEPPRIARGSASFDRADGASSPTEADVLSSSESNGPELHTTHHSGDAYAPASHTGSHAVAVEQHPDELDNAPAPTPLSAHSFSPAVPGRGDPQDEAEASVRKGSSAGNEDRAPGSEAASRVAEEEFADNAPAPAPLSAHSFSPAVPGHGNPQDEAEASLRKGSSAGNEDRAPGSEAASRVAGEEFADNAAASAARSDAGVSTRGRGHDDEKLAEDELRHRPASSSHGSPHMSAADETESAGSHGGATALPGPGLKEGTSDEDLARTLPLKLSRPAVGESDEEPANISPCSVARASEDLPGGSRGAPAACDLEPSPEDSDVIKTDSTAADSKPIECSPERVAASDEDHTPTMGSSKGSRRVSTDSAASSLKVDPAETGRDNSNVRSTEGSALAEDAARNEAVPSTPRRASDSSLCGSTASPAHSVAEPEEPDAHGTSQLQRATEAPDEITQKQIGNADAARGKVGNASEVHSDASIENPNTPTAPDQATPNEAAQSRSVPEHEHPGPCLEPVPVEVSEHADDDESPHNQDQAPSASEALEEPGREQATSSGTPGTPQTEAAPEKGEPDAGHCGMKLEEHDGAVDTQVPGPAAADDDVSISSEDSRSAMLSHVSNYAGLPHQETASVQEKASNPNGLWISAADLAAKDDRIVTLERYLEEALQERARPPAADASAGTDEPEANEQEQQTDIEPAPLVETTSEVVGLSVSEVSTPRPSLDANAVPALPKDVTAHDDDDDSFNLTCTTAMSPRLAPAGCPASNSPEGSQQSSAASRPEARLAPDGDNPNAPCEVASAMAVLLSSESATFFLGLDPSFEEQGDRSSVSLAELTDRLDLVLQSHRLLPPSTPANEAGAGERHDEDREFDPPSCRDACVQIDISDDASSAARSETPPSSADSLRSPSKAGSYTETGVQVSLSEHGDASDYEAEEEPESKEDSQVDPSSVKREHDQGAAPDSAGDGASNSPAKSFPSTPSQAPVGSAELFNKLQDFSNDLAERRETTRSGPRANDAAVSELEEAEEEARLSLHREEDEAFPHTLLVPEDDLRDSSSLITLVSLAESWTQHLRIPSEQGEQTPDLSDNLPQTFSPTVQLVGSAESSTTAPFSPELPRTAASSPDELELARRHEISSASPQGPEGRSPSGIAPDVGHSRSETREVLVDDELDFVPGSTSEMLGSIEEGLEALKRTLNRRSARLVRRELVGDSDESDRSAGSVELVDVRGQEERRLQAVMREAKDCEALVAHGRKLAASQRLSPVAFEPQNPPAAEPAATWYRDPIFERHTERTTALLEQLRSTLALAGVNLAPPHEPTPLTPPSITPPRSSLAVHPTPTDNRLRVKFAESEPESPRARPPVALGSLEPASRSPKAGDAVTMGDAFNAEDESPRRWTNSERLTAALSRLDTALRLGHPAGEPDPTRDRAPSASGESRDLFDAPKPSGTDSEGSEELLDASHFSPSPNRPTASTRQKLGAGRGRGKGRRSEKKKAKASRRRRVPAGDAAVQDEESCDESLQPYGDIVLPYTKYRGARRAKLASPTLKFVKSRRGIDLLYASSLSSGVASPPPFLPPRTSPPSTSTGTELSTQPFAAGLGTTHPVTRRAGHDSTLEPYFTRRDVGDQLTELSRLVDSIGRHGTDPNGARSSFVYNAASPSADRGPRLLDSRWRESNADVLTELPKLHPSAQSVLQGLQEVVWSSGIAGATTASEDNRETSLDSQEQEQLLAAAVGYAAAATPETRPRTLSSIAAWHARKGRDGEGVVLAESATSWRQDPRPSGNVPQFDVLPVIGTPFASNPRRPARFDGDRYTAGLSDQLDTAESEISRLRRSKQRQDTEPVSSSAVFIPPFATDVVASPPYRSHSQGAQQRGSPLAADSDLAKFSRGKSLGSAWSVDGTVSERSGRSRTRTASPPKTRASASLSDVRSDARGEFESKWLEAKALEAAYRGAKTYAQLMEDNRGLLHTRKRSEERAGTRGVQPQDMESLTARLEAILRKEIEAKKPLVQESRFVSISPYPVFPQRKPTRSAVREVGTATDPPSVKHVAVQTGGSAKLEFRSCLWITPARDDEPDDESQGGYPKRRASWKPRPGGPALDNGGNGNGGNGLPHAAESGDSTEEAGGSAMPENEGHYEDGAGNTMRLNEVMGFYAVSMSDTQPPDDDASRMLSPMVVPSVVQSAPSTDGCVFLDEDYDFKLAGSAPLALEGDELLILHMREAQWRASLVMEESAAFSAASRNHPLLPAPAGPFGPTVTGDDFLILQLHEAQWRASLVTEESQAFSDISHVHPVLISRESTDAPVQKVIGDDFLILHMREAQWRASLIMEESWASLAFSQVHPVLDSRVSADAPVQKVLGDDFLILHMREAQWRASLIMEESWASLAFSQVHPVLDSRVNADAPAQTLLGDDVLILQLREAQWRASLMMEESWAALGISQVHPRLDSRESTDAPVQKVVGDDFLILHMREAQWRASLIMEESWASSALPHQGLSVQAGRDTVVPIGDECVVLLMDEAQRRASLVMEESRAFAAAFLCHPALTPQAAEQKNTAVVYVGDDILVLHLKEAQWRASFILEESQAFTAVFLCHPGLANSQVAASSEGAEVAASVVQIGDDFLILHMREAQWRASFISEESQAFLSAVHCHPALASVRGAAASAQIGEDVLMLRMLQAQWRAAVVMEESEAFSGIVHGHPGLTYSPAAKDATAPAVLIGDDFLILHMREAQWRASFISEESQAFLSAVHCHPALASVRDASAPVAQIGEDVLMLRMLQAQWRAAVVMEESEAFSGIVHGHPGLACSQSAKAKDATAPVVRVVGDDFLILHMREAQWRASFISEESQAFLAAVHCHPALASARDASAHVGDDVLMLRMLQAQWRAAVVTEESEAFAGIVHGHPGLTYSPAANAAAPVVHVGDDFLILHMIEAQGRASLIMEESRALSAAFHYHPLLVPRFEHLPGAGEVWSSVVLAEVETADLSPTLAAPESDVLQAEEQLARCDVLRGEMAGLSRWCVAYVKLPVWRGNGGAVSLPDRMDRTLSRAGSQGSPTSLHGWDFGWQSPPRRDTPSNMRNLTPLWAVDSTDDDTTDPSTAVLRKCKVERACGGSIPPSPNPTGLDHPALLPVFRQQIAEADTRLKLAEDQARAFTEAAQRFFSELVLQLCPPLEEFDGSASSAASTRFPTEPASPDVSQSLTVRIQCPACGASDPADYNNRQQHTQNHPSFVADAESTGRTTVLFEESTARLDLFSFQAREILSEPAAYPPCDTREFDPTSVAPLSGGELVGKFARRQPLENRQWSVDSSAVDDLPAEPAAETPLGPDEAVAALRQANVRIVELEDACAASDAAAKEASAKLSALALRSSAWEAEKRQLQREVDAAEELVGKQARDDDFIVAGAVRVAKTTAELESVVLLSSRHVQFCEAETRLRLVEKECQRLRLKLHASDLALRSQSPHDDVLCTIRNLERELSRVELDASRRFVTLEEYCASLEDENRRLLCRSDAPGDWHGGTSSVETLDAVSRFGKNLPLGSDWSVLPTDSDEDNTPVSPFSSPALACSPLRVPPQRTPAFVERRDTLIVPPADGCGNPGKAPLRERSDFLMLPAAAPEGDASRSLHAAHKSVLTLEDRACGSGLSEIVLEPHYQGYAVYLPFGYERSAAGSAGSLLPGRAANVRPPTRDGAAQTDAPQGARLEISSSSSAVLPSPVPLFAKRVQASAWAADTRPVPGSAAAGGSTRLEPACLSTRLAPAPVLLDPRRSSSATPEAVPAVLRTESESFELAAASAKDLFERRDTVIVPPGDAWGCAGDPALVAGFADWPAPAAAERASVDLTGDVPRLVERSDTVLRFPQRSQCASPTSAAPRAEPLLHPGTWSFAADTDADLAALEAVAARVQIALAEACHTSCMPAEESESEDGFACLLSETCCTTFTRDLGETALSSPLREYAFSTVIRKESEKGSSHAEHPKPTPTAPDPANVELREERESYTRFVNRRAGLTGRLPALVEARVAMLSPEASAQECSNPVSPSSSARALRTSDQHTQADVITIVQSKFNEGGFVVDQEAQTEDDPLERYSVRMSSMHHSEAQTECAEVLLVGQTLSSVKEVEKEQTRNKIGVACGDGLVGKTPRPQAEVVEKFGKSERLGSEWSVDTTDEEATTQRDSPVSVKTEKAAFKASSCDSQTQTTEAQSQLSSLSAQREPSNEIQDVSTLTDVDLLKPPVLREHRVHFKLPVASPATAPELRQIQSFAEDSSDTQSYGEGRRATFAYDEASSPSGAPAVDAFSKGLALGSAWSVGTSASEWSNSPRPSAVSATDGAFTVPGELALRDRFEAMNAVAEAVAAKAELLAPSANANEVEDLRKLLEDAEDRARDAKKRNDDLNAELSRAQGTLQAQVEEIERLRLRTQEYTKQLESFLSETPSDPEDRPAEAYSTQTLLSKLRACVDGAGRFMTKDATAWALSWLDCGDVEQTIDVLTRALKEYQEAPAPKRIRMDHDATMDTLIDAVCQEVSQLADGLSDADADRLIDTTVRLRDGWKACALERAVLTEQVAKLQRGGHPTEASDDGETSAAIRSKMRACVDSARRFMTEEASAWAHSWLDSGDVEQSLDVLTQSLTTYAPPAPKVRRTDSETAMDSLVDAMFQEVSQIADCLSDPDAERLIDATMRLRTGWQACAREKAQLAAEKDALLNARPAARHRPASTQTEDPRESPAPPAPGGPRDDAWAAADHQALLAKLRELAAFLDEDERRRLLALLDAGDVDAAAEFLLAKPTRAAVSNRATSSPGGPAVEGEEEEAEEDVAFDQLAPLREMMSLRNQKRDKRPAKHPGLDAALKAEHEKSELRATLQDAADDLSAWMNESGKWQLAVRLQDNDVQGAVELVAESARTYRQARGAPDKWDFDRTKKSTAANLEDRVEAIFSEASPADGLPMYAGQLVVLRENVLTAIRAAPLVAQVETLSQEVGSLAKDEATSREELALACESLQRAAREERFERAALEAANVDLRLQLADLQSAPAFETTKRVEKSTWADNLEKNQAGASDETEANQRTVEAVRHLQTANESLLLELEQKEEKLAGIEVQLRSVSDTVMQGMHEEQREEFVASLDAGGFQKTLEILAETATRAPLLASSQSSVHGTGISQDTLHTVSQGLEVNNKEAVRHLQTANESLLQELEQQEEKLAGIEVQLRSVSEIVMQGMHEDQREELVASLDAGNFQKTLEIIALTATLAPLQASSQSSVRATGRLSQDIPATVLQSLEDSADSEAQGRAKEAVSHLQTANESLLQELEQQEKKLAGIEVQLRSVSDTVMQGMHEEQREELVASLDAGDFQKTLEIIAQTATRQPLLASSQSSVHKTSTVSEGTLATLSHNQEVGGDDQAQGRAKDTVYRLQTANESLLQELEQQEEKLAGIERQLRSLSGTVMQGMDEEQQEALVVSLRAGDLQKTLEIIVQAAELARLELNSGSASRGTGADLQTLFDTTELKCAEAKTLSTGSAGREATEPSVPLIPATCSFVQDAEDTDSDLRVTLDEARQALRTLADDVHSFVMQDEREWLKSWLDSNDLRQAIDLVSNSAQRQVTDARRATHEHVVRESKPDVLVGSFCQELSQLADNVSDEESERLADLASRLKGVVDGSSAPVLRQNDDTQTTIVTLGIATNSLVMYPEDADPDLKVTFNEMDKSLRALADDTRSFMSRDEGEWLKSWLDSNDLRQAIDVVCNSAQRRVNECLQASQERIVRELPAENPDALIDSLCQELSHLADNASDEESERIVDLASRLKGAINNSRKAQADDVTQTPLVALAVAMTSVVQYAEDTDTELKDTFNDMDRSLRALANDLHGFMSDDEREWLKSWLDSKDLRQAIDLLGNYQETSLMLWSTPCARN
ncbi:hypothetical protein DIPPA_04399 [Diplonema papillatum]|nr:hypothetical protein DIPPA_04399 [Diplonema papillatum]